MRARRTSQMGEDSRERQGVCDAVAWRRAPLFTRFIVAISLTNLELLKLLPWTSDAYDGLPTAELLKLTFFNCFVEDIPQLALQTAYIFYVQRDPLQDVLVVFSALISLISLCWRGT